MKSKVLPLVAAVIALVLGSAAGLGWFWIRASSMLAAKAKEAPPPEKVAIKAKGWDFWTIEIDNLSRELKEEKERVRAQQDALDARSSRIAAERQELEKVRDELTKLRDEITSKVVEIQKDESKNLKVLAQTYSTLTPHAAVAIMHELDDATVVKILSLMKPDIIGPIFEDMAQSDPSGASAKRAALLSEKLRMMKAQRTAQNP